MRVIKLALRSAIVMVVLSAGVAHAVAPLTETYHLSFPPGPLAACDEFVILWGSELDITETTYFDAEGVPVRAKIVFRGTDTFINSITGAQVTGSPYAAQTVDLTTGIYRAQGLLFQVVVPGVGVVFIDAGIEVFEFAPDGSFNLLLVGGKHQFYDGDFETLCNALSGMPGKPAPLVQEDTWGRVKRLFR